MKIYVASWLENAPSVRALHERLRSFGMTPTSSWAYSARGPEDFGRYTPEELREIAHQNDRDLDGSDAVIVIAAAGVGGETFAEACRALLAGKPVFWVGRRTLSAWREGVTRCEDLDDAIAHLVGRAFSA